MATKSKNIIDVESIKDSTKNVNNFIIDTTEMIVDETLDRTAAWQNLADKAIKGGFKLAETQADITFKALETLKKQWFKGQKNFRQRLNN